MPELENQPEIPAVKPKRAYHRRQTAPTPPAQTTPEMPNPTILALQNDILELVKQRTVANQEIARANHAVSQATFSLQAARENLNNLEREVQYRMSLIAQMRGQTPMVPAAYPFEAPAPDYGHGYASGVSSIPAPVQPYTPVPGEGPRIRSESAEGFRDAEVGARRAI